MNVTMGSYEVHELGEMGIGNLFEGKVVYDKTYGQVTYGCTTCCGLKEWRYYYDPLGIPLNETSQQDVQGVNNCNGTWQDITGYFNGGSWSTANPAIATVNSNGLHTGASEGSTTTSTCSKNNMTVWQRSTSCPLQPVCPDDANVDVGDVSCSPSSVTRGNSTTCTASGPSGSTFSGWKFTDQNGNPPVTSSSTNSTWPGQMVTSGTVSVTVHTSDGGQQVRTASVTVANRNWHTSPATSAEVPNGTFITLPVPPQNTGVDSGLGYSKWQITDNGLSGTTISDNGPNNGYYYYGANLTYSQFYYQYEINPDLENSGTDGLTTTCTHLIRIQTRPRYNRASASTGPL